MSERYSPDELIGLLEKQKMQSIDRITGESFNVIGDNGCDAIIARLRAGDKLCEDVKHDIECSNHVDRICALIRKAIADYEGKK
jgi:hypothetical protein